MYILFFLIWILFNGQVTAEIVIFGLAIAAFLYGFICKFMDFSFHKDLLLAGRLFGLIGYGFVLIWEIIKANFIVIRLITSSRCEPEPVLVHFKTDLKSMPARVLLANSITLTPGTITVSLTEDEYVVHCLDKELAVGLDTSVFVKLLKRLESTK